MIRRSALAVVLMALGLALTTVAASGPAEAQGLLDRLFGAPTVAPMPQPPPPTTRRPGGLLDLLFGPPGTVAPPQALPGAPPVRVGPPPVAAVKVIPKDPNARKIVVVGDFVASGIAWGLDQTFAEEPRLAVVDRSNAGSGLVRDEVYDWNAELLNVLNEEKPDVVVVAIGADDRQAIRTGNGQIETHTPEWDAAYTKRIAGMVDTLKVYGRPFFWVGAPPMRVTAAMRDMLALNGLFQPAVEAAGGHFVDIWNGFTDENGNYISSGPDVDGQLRALRTSDGINFTRAGRLKLAFYVEREIHRQTGLGAGSVDLVTSTDQRSHIEIGPDGKKRLVGPVISLSEPLPGASSVLAGGPTRKPVVETTAQYRMIVKGEALPEVPGRADDFSWPPSQRAPLVPLIPTAGAPDVLSPAASAN